ncbi:glycine C-acetyltransferase [Deinobacterium chartae]|uniref:Glycine C-acetyltransferase n=1 Tax=Deinobacterium chartae TaxID=521158 RepID=A0A841I0Q1_9DEIO|nr:aminotransferase class I/II-fold pyridoxal phosphate-dependent enzyme [Deinobacterium chartae]MBB6099371.1 glycine C-acetyltransferase [Deinobacterium chartae]
MPADRLSAHLEGELKTLEDQGRRKARETVITGVEPPQGGRGPRYRVEGEPGRAYLRMNANSYLGLSRHPRLLEAAEQAARSYGSGPGAVRFISGTFAPHADLERRLAAFHGREAALLFSSAYAAVLGTLISLITPQTAVISDELNHNSIINALRLARPQRKDVYRHLDLADLEVRLRSAVGARRAVVVTDGVFSMRGVHAPLDRVAARVSAHDPHFPENALLVVDDSHGVGALGASGRGSEELCGTRADLLIGTLGKAFGVNGGYVVGSRALIDYLREVAPLTVFSNPISPAEAAAACAALELTDSAWGRERLAHLRALTDRFRRGLRALGLETLSGEHPVVPLFVRDAARTRALVARLRERQILVTGLTFPVVPAGDESLRFQISAEHTEADIDEVLAALEAVSGWAAAGLED